MQSQLNRLPYLTTFAALLLSLVWLGAASHPVTAQTPEPQPTTRSITVAGSGQVSTQPDVAVVVVGVQTEATSAGEALTQNSQQMAGVIDTFNAAGVADEDIQTQAVQLLPNTPDEGQPPQQPLPQATGALTATEAVTSTTPVTPTSSGTTTSYIAVNLVEVRVRDLANLGSVLDSAIQAGGNQIQSIRFEVSDPNAALDQARETAWADARRKAEQLAGLAGAELGEVLTINDYTVAPYPVAQASVAGRGGAGVPIEPGSQTVMVNVQVTWQLQ